MRAQIVLLGALLLVAGGEAAAASLKATSSVAAADLLYLFDRPPEPVFTLRGVNRDVAYDVPADYLPERYKAVASVIAAQANQTGVRLIPVPVLDATLLAQAEANFSTAASELPYRSGKYSRASHIEYAALFETFFQDAATNDELLSRAVWARLRYHPELVLDGLRGALLRRPGVQQGVQVPLLTQYTPEMFVDDKFFAKLREEMYIVPDGQRIVIPVIRNETQTDTNESKVWYWLEDTHLSIFHWQWHINYPWGNDVDNKYVIRDRRGELFVFFHRQMLGRLHAERLCNGVPRLQPLDYKQPVAEAFFPKMLDLHTGRGYPGRQANTSLLPQTQSVAELDLWHDRYRQALKQGYFEKADGTQITLEGTKGLDLVADTIESSNVLSANSDFYGTIHNQIHDIMSMAHDPLKQNYETISLMAVLPTVRDTGFYRLHLHIDDLFEEYKTAFLKPYQDYELSWTDVSIQSLSVRSDVSRTDNELHTYWQETDLDVSLGLDYTPAGHVYGRFRHLQHEAFTYNIQILNEGLSEVRGFVRIFLIMLTDENGQPLETTFQQRFAIEMDRFDVSLEPGVNEITRASTDTPLTINQDDIYTKQSTYYGARRVNQCRCGWPQTLLLPRGTADGLKYRLFAMVTDYSQDKTPASADEICHDGWLLCGVPGSTYYPDKRPMGFPFDRPFRNETTTIDAFLTKNMAVQDVVIKFDDSRVDAPSALLPGDVSTTWMP